MAKIAPKGEIFADGQILNKPQGLPGKNSMKNVKKDHALLSSMGVKNPSNLLIPAKPVKQNSSSNRLKEESFFQPEKGKLAFKSHLSESERNAVRKVSNVSEELSMKLLAPTPGSRILMKHLTRDSKEELEKVKTKDEIEALRKAKVRENQMGAQKLLKETKNLKVSVNVPPPRLGRGTSSGFIDLDFNSSAKKTCTSTAKTAAILALKGKSLPKVDPNYTQKRKRSLEDVEESKRKVSKALNNSIENDEISNGEKNVKTPKQIVRSFTGEILDENRLEELKNRKSLNQNLVNVAELEEEEQYFKQAEKKEAMEEKMINTKEIEAK